MVGFGRKGWVTGEDDQEGFEIPVPEKECIVVEENAVAAEGKNIQTKDGEKLNVALAYDKAGAGFVCSIANVYRKQREPPGFSPCRVLYPLHRRSSPLRAQGDVQVWQRRAQ